MDSSQYKDTTTPRGLKYHYFFISASGDKPTLLFLHGFPSTSSDWHKQVEFFVKKGYGVLVPDMLGYGGTDKPSDPVFYKKKSIAEDVVSLIDTENLRKVFAIAHDWGCGVCSALAQYYPNRFKGFAFLAVGYIPPSPDFDIEKFLQFQKSTVGYETYSYWLFFCEDGVDKILEEKIDSFLSILYPRDAKLWHTDMTPRGALKSWITEGRTADRPEYLTEENLETIKKNLLQGGLAAPLCWYKATVHGYNNKDDEGVPQDRYVVKSPTFLGTALQDYACTALAARFIMENLCPEREIKDYDTGHWIQLAVPEQLNSDLLEWISKYE